MIPNLVSILPLGYLEEDGSVGGGREDLGLLRRNGTCLMGEAGPAGLMELWERG